MMIGATDDADVSSEDMGKARETGGQHCYGRGGGYIVTVGVCVCVRLRTGAF